MDVTTVGPWMLAADPQMPWGTDEVCVDIIMVLDWASVRSGWTLFWFWPNAQKNGRPVDALGEG